MMRPWIAEAVWLLGGAAWFVIRYPHQRRARRVAIARSVGGRRDQWLLASSLTGLCIIPLIYVVIAWITGQPQFADYAYLPLQPWIGLALMAAALMLFHATHRQLGKNWSVTLDTRQTHQLVATGVYSLVRHPMYSAFWLLALAQATLIPNWIAGLSGILGWGILFFLRVEREERLMLETFGDEYRGYMRRTARVVPWVY
jgi:protein-S-isoprenylcysteine O-methyltransferase Ste14